MKLNDVKIGITELSDFHIATLFCSLVKLRGDLDNESNKSVEIMQYKGESIDANKLIEAINTISDLITNKTNNATSQLDDIT